MPQYSEVPGSAQGGGSTTNPADVIAFADLISGNPEAAVQADPDPGFALLKGESDAENARDRTGSAAHRMRGKVAKRLGIPKSGIRAMVRAVEHDAKGKVRGYSYWLQATEDGQTALAELAELAAQDTEENTEENGK